jgi:transcriptional regulator of heat shock response
MTPRQRQLLAAIIQEFIETAEAVGSNSLYDKYKFKVSPATIRNEMAELVREGYLDKPHSSSGRVPTALGLRYFIQELLDEMLEPDVVTQEQIKQQMHAARFSKEELLRSAMRFLVQYSGNAAVSLINKEVYYAGLAEMLNIPELQQIENLRSLLLVLEDYSILSKIFNQSHSEGEVKVLIGEESGLDIFQPYAIVFSELRLHGGKFGYIAVIGPNRMDYRRVIPAVKFVANTINRLASGW